MLSLKDIVKVYKSGDIEVKALKGINLAFRDNEFVSILGPSGCGKTTLLNIIGGLDHYTSGDLIIDGISTTQFKDKDWDIYRNHKIGFIFQSYNLIPHQTILENVELALTISGVSKEERTKLAKESLDRVGLKGHYNKKPNQLSGGQCQRVAIARALVNSPDILLADEPTGALDTETSIQIMELIKEISKEKLVIMVTHNPELAYEYSSRIVKILDGNIIHDSNPYNPSEKEINNIVRTDSKTLGKAKMSWWTAFKLSSKNLLSKFRRTILTCIAGSIGIVGICSVLAVSSGVKGYIYSMQDDMLSGNPITIEESGYDLQSIMGKMSTGDKLNAVIKNGFVNVDGLIAYLASMIDKEDGMLINNEITPEYIEYIKAMPKEYYNDISLRYGVNLSNNIYTTYKDKVYNKDTNTLEDRTREVSISGINSIYGSVLKNTEFGDYANMVTTLTSPLMQSLPNEEFLLSQYDIKAGEMANSKDEMMIIVNSEQELVDLVLAQLGYYSQDEFIERAMHYKDPNFVSKNEFSFEELMSKEFTYYPNDDIFKPVDYSEIVKKLDGLLLFMPQGPEKDQLTTLRDFLKGASPFIYRSVNENFTLSDIIPTDNKHNYPKFENGIKLKIKGILMPKEGRLYTALPTGFYYTQDLVEYSISQNKNSELIKYANNNLDDKGNFFFGIQDNNTKKMTQHIPHLYKYTPFIEDPTKLEGDPTSQGVSIVTPNPKSGLNEMINSMMGGKNQSIGPEMREFGGKETPNGLWLYPINFEEKDLATNYLDAWNKDGDITLSNGTVLTKDMRNTITYQDNLEIVITMINNMVNMITIALICFTSLALVVSCVMIAIITYVSVMERIKEIGIIRALGGRKRDVSNLFNAETIIIGVMSGALGVGISYILSIIVSIVVRHMTGIFPIADLQWYQALFMMGISIVLTAVSGFIPAHSASKKDPVVALRTE